MILAIDQWLMRSAAALLLLVALVKMVSAFSKVAYLAHPDPVLSFISIRLLLLSAGETELLFALRVALRPQAWYARCSLLALCATFVFYRIGLLALHVHAPCPCLGRASDWLRLKPQQADDLALLLLAMLGAIAITSIGIHARKQGAGEPVVGR
jgi:hypothetical protein